jgi:hypothetical protein
MGEAVGQFAEYAATDGLTTVEEIGTEHIDVGLHWRSLRHEIGSHSTWDTNVQVTTSDESDLL